MKQASLKLKMSIRSVDITNNNIETQRVVLSAMLFILGILALLYVLILGNTVLNIVQRRAMEKEMLSLSNEVRNFELSYLSISNEIDLPLSSSMGFKEARVNFAIRKSLGYNATSEAFGNLNFNRNEI